MFNFATFEPYKKESSRNVLIVFCMLQIFIQLMVLKYLYVVQTQALVYQRTFQFIFAVVILFSLFKFRNFWTTKRCTMAFFLFYLHMAYLGWQTEILLSHSPGWIPYTSFKLQVVVLAFLVPGPYLFNLILLGCLCVLAIVQWFYIPIRTSPNAILTVEPYLSIIYTGVSLALIWFRYRDQKIIELLSRQKERADVSQKVTSAMLSMKDRLNTPIQCQILAVEMLKKGETIKPELLKSLEMSTKKIVGVTRMIDLIEKEYPSLSTDLMTDQEISAFLGQNESENSKFNEF